jgi:hypothetical protein
MVEFTPKTVPLVYHVLQATSAIQTNANDATLAAQTASLNEAFGANPSYFADMPTDGPYSFTTSRKGPNIVFEQGATRRVDMSTGNLGAVTFASDGTNTVHYPSGSPVAINEVEARAAVVAASPPSPGAMNVYICETAPGSRLLGFTTGFGEGTDVVIVLRCLEPGSPSEFNIIGSGKHTVTHEIGHALGLYHIFEALEGGDGGGEAFTDTPVQINPNTLAHLYNDGGTVRGRMCNHEIDVALAGGDLPDYWTLPDDFDGTASFAHAGVYTFKFGISGQSAGTVLTTLMTGLANLTGGSYRIVVGPNGSIAYGIVYGLSSLTAAFAAATNAVDAINAENANIGLNEPPITLQNISANVAVKAMLMGPPFSVEVSVPLTVNLLSGEDSFLAVSTNINDVTLTSLNAYFGGAKIEPTVGEAAALLTIRVCGLGTAVAGAAALKAALDINEAGLINVVQNIIEPNGYTKSLSDVAQVTYTETPVSYLGATGGEREMFMNFMDYSADSELKCFTEQQAAEMRANVDILLAAGGGGTGSQTPVFPANSPQILMRLNGDAFGIVSLPPTISSNVYTAIATKKKTQTKRFRISTVTPIYNDSVNAPQALIDFHAAMVAAIDPTGTHWARSEASYDDTTDVTTYTIRFTPKEGASTAVKDALKAALDDAVAQITSSSSNPLKTALEAIVGTTAIIAASVVASNTDIPVAEASSGISTLTVILIIIGVIATIVFLAVIYGMIIQPTWWKNMIG